MNQRPDPPSLGHHQPRTAHGHGHGHGHRLEFGRDADVPPIPDPTRYRQARSRRSRLLLAAKVMGVLLVLAVTTVGLVVAFAPVEAIRDQLAREVKARTGRDLVIAGRPSLSVWPSLAVSLGEVSLSAPPGMAGPPLIKARRVDATASLSALLLRRVEIKSLTLTDPIIELRVDRTGRQSWEFAAAPPLTRLAQATPPGNSRTDMPPELAEFLRNSSGNGSDGIATPPAKAQARTGAAAAAPAMAVALGDIRILNGTLRYRDERTTTALEANRIDARLEAGNLTGPIKAEGRFAMAGQDLRFDARLASAADLGRGRPTGVQLSVTAPAGGGRLDGVVAGGSAHPQLEGKIAAETQSLRTLLGLFGVQAPVDGGLGPAALKAGIAASTSSLTLTNSTFELDGMRATGQLAVAMGGTRPVVTAALQTGRLDLGRYSSSREGVAYRPAAARPQAAQPRPPSGQPSGGQSGQRAAPSIEDLIRGTVDQTEPGAAGRFAPRVKGFMHRDGWSQEPINLSALGAVDGDVTLALQGVSIGGFDVGPSRFKLALRNKALKVTVEEANLYQGRGRGLITLDASGRAPALGTNLTFTQVASRPVLKLASGTEWIDGKADIRLVLGGAGQSERQIVDSLNGKAELVIRNGAVLGYDVGGRIARLGRGQFSGLDPVAGEQTPFSEAGATFAITSGVARSQDIRLVAADLSIAGGGTVELGQRRLDLLLRPKLAGRAAELAGIDIPVRIEGSWDNPRLKPDVNAVLKNPDKAIEAIDNIGRQYGAKNLGNTLRNLLGRPGQDGGGSTGGGLGRSLDNLLRR